MLTIKVKSVFVLLVAIVCLGFSKEVLANDIYQIKIYHYSTSEQEAVLEKYLETAYLPALHRLGISDVGVFKPVEVEEEKQLYVLVPFSNQEQLFGLKAELAKDEEYSSTGKDYLEAAHDNPPYDRMEIILLDAFSEQPHYQTPKLSSPNAERIYELRSYESATEKLHVNKVEMFNEGGEVALFEKLGFNAVFYGRVIAGSHMPNLMYMTSFENMDDRNKHWEAFGGDPFWKELSGKPEYQNNVSHIDITFLYPTEYSDL
ncbi:NIPSNAP family protein [Galbibacter sp. EGI 63066]|uniref:NIPSNAP family protein n=1 Tax=Galbibacter sp. EGI 63066 TaxID=2993559 RepID=UPI00224881C7|nr:NIPSNAP family protein [Galbibacter sp. EGI 63066]MCX2678416.1 NIPSNAP family protein [Galbibacter sp. EGI 63066]